MATIQGLSKILSDNGMTISGGASTALGAAQAKGTATDLLLSIVAGAGVTVAGSTALTIQGSNVTSTVLTNWTAVTADKGTAVTPVTTSGVQSLHFAQLQYAFYRVQAIASTTATLNLVTVFNYSPVQDTADATVA